MPRLYFMDILVFIVHRMPKLGNHRQSYSHKNDFAKVSKNLARYRSENFMETSK